MSNIYITNPLPGEKLVLVIKKHVIVYIEVALYLVLGLITTIAILIVFHSIFLLKLVLVIFWMAFPLFLVVHWLDNALDMFIITNKRIIGVEQISFLNKIVSECNLSQVEEVGSHTKGFLANFFNFGDVNIQTAGNKTNFNMNYVPDPIKAAGEINTIINKYGKFKPRTAQNLES